MIKQEIVARKVLSIEGLTMGVLNPYVFEGTQVAVDLSALCFVFDQGHAKFIDQLPSKVVACIDQEELHQCEWTPKQV